jgi:chromosome segregation protein
MRIKKLEVIGFKSFADREVIHVDEQVTGVIGPNGCGKSNIVDAIRWSLGEQRAKHLRGSGMQDVIFAGSATRGPGGMAEVTLTFENDGSAPPPFANYAEIAITRRLYNDGTSEYLINKVPCRLRDIHELMLGTGAGARGYSIIEQGQVGKIVSSKPEDRRTMLDEAAGITRFKAQKQAAERRIEQTQQNLLRVSDVVGELEGRLGTLRKQAQKAERYKRYRGELRELELWSSSHRFLELAVTSRVLGARRGDLAEQVEALRSALSGHEGRIEAHRLELAQREAALSAAQQQIFDLEKQLQLGEAEEGFRRREQESLGQAVALSRSEAATVERGLAALEQELAEARASLEEMADGPGGSEDAVERWSAEHEELNARHRGARVDLDRARDEQGRLHTRAATLRAQSESRADSLADLSQRIAGIDAELEGLAAAGGGAEAEQSSARAAHEAAAQAVEDLQARRQELDRERQRLREEVRRADQAAGTRRSAADRARSRLASLEEIQARYRGCASGVQVLMQRRGELGGGAGLLGIMADYIAAPASLEAALSSVLGDRLQGVVVDAPAVALEGVALLRRAQEGRTSFLPRSCRPVEPQEDATLLAAPGVLGRLSSLVEAGEEMRPIVAALLGDTVVVEGLERALELWHAGARWPMVTPEGDRIEPSGVIVGGSAKGLDSALLQQKREIRELASEVEALSAAHEEARAEHAALVERLSAVEGEREASEAYVLEAEKTRLAHAQELRRLEASLQQMASRQAGLRRDRERLELSLRERSGERASLTQELAAAELRLPALEAAIYEGQAQIEGIAEQRDRIAEMLTEAKVALARWQQQRGALEAAKGRLERQVTSERDRARRLVQHASEGEARIVELDGAIAAAREEREALLDRHAAAVQVGHDRREAYEGARASVDETELAIRNLRGERDEQRERLREIEMALKELQLELGHLEADVRERFDCELAEVLIDFHDREPAGASAGERARELKRILGRMGEVNLTAIEEYEEVAGRFEFLTSQKKDLEEAISQLQEAIEKINKTTRDRFIETFKSVDAMFQQIFPRLFNGGRAELRLTDAGDLLNTGVEIIAQPPGKQVRSLELLSGGEKALTAVSLIFAIFLIKPSPFCLLDEVDAPLDEANVGRFGNLVREMAERTQFIIITHNKRTMEIADRLYGVTMEQRGVSKLVSVNIRRAVESMYS